MIIRFFILSLSLLISQSWFNHPEVTWETIESEHFLVHYHNGTKRTAYKVVDVAEFIYAPVTDMYNYRPRQKTNIIIRDTDDFSNGSAFFFDNKIEIWASPLDFDLRGSHSWIENVITHEFVHIIQLGASLKHNRHIPAFYLQIMDYEDERREDVLYGYPNSIISYSAPSVSVPPWFAEGVAQFMYDNANYDFWDTHRDMILRDAFLNNSIFNINQMNSFGKTGLGNEQIYIQGFSLASYIAQKFGSDTFKLASEEISKPLQYSFSVAIKNVTGESLEKIYQGWYNSNLEKYKNQKDTLYKKNLNSQILIKDGTTNLHPVWSQDGSKFAYLSNQGKDYFGQTDLYVYDFLDSSNTKLVASVSSAPVWLNDTTVIFSKKSEPNQYGSKYYDLYLYELNQKKKKPKRLTYDSRFTSPSIDYSSNSLAVIGMHDGVSNIYVSSLDLIDSLSFNRVTNLEKGEKLFSLSFDQNKILFDIVEDHMRDILLYDIKEKSYSSIEEDVWDDRDPFYHQDQIVFSSDRSGIFNIYTKDESGIKSISNVIGGAFMPSMSKDGKLLYSMYQEGRYSIVIADILIDDDIGLVSDYEQYQYPNIKPSSYNSLNSKEYEEDLSLPFIFPRLFFDYGTLKPGFYFYSSDALDKYFLFGGGSINKLSDLDVFLLFELRKNKPTLYTNLYWITRNVGREQNFTSVTGDIYENLIFDSDDTYIMFSVDMGSRIAFKSNKFSINYNYSKYTAHSIGYTRLYHNENLESSSPFDISYDYYRGHKLTFAYNLKAYYPQYAFNMIPQNGFEINADASIERNDFDPEFKISEEFGTLSLVFSPHNTRRFNLEVKKNISLYKKKRIVFNQLIKAGYITNKSIDDFFYYFGGGLTGIRGYTFYNQELSGTQILISTSAIRAPIFLEKNYKVLHLLIQNLSLNYIFQVGGISIDDFKYSNGMELRLNGSSFYAFPFALSYEYHTPINDSIEASSKHYIKLLFEFMN